MRAGLLAACLLWASPAGAYNLATVASDSCHERLTIEALLTILEIFGGRPVPVPDDDVLRRLIDDFSQFGIEDLSESEKFVIFSAIVGVRAPDTEGHSTLDLAALRRLHADPAPEGQYAHALRGPDDDGVQGDITAVDGTLALIRGELDEVLRFKPGSGLDPVGKRSQFIPHYGPVKVSVFLPAYHLGRAIHALQDAHAHMVWDATISHVIHVLNYVDAVDGHLKSSRDGLAHSGALDDCDRADTQPMVSQATTRSAALAVALLQAVDGDPAAIEEGLNPCPPGATNTITCGWLVYNPECRAAVAAGDSTATARVCCTADNDYCESPYIEIAKEEPAHPYLGCQGSPGSAGWLLTLLLLAGLRRRAALPLLLLACLPGGARAEAPAADAPVEVRAPAPPRAFVALEGHGSFLNDTPNASLLDVTFGYSARMGYRWGRWRAVLHVEQNAWLGLEFGSNLTAGVLNVGLGGEALLFDDVVRVGVTFGPSVLLYDTELDEAGSTGLFSELRPIGFRYPALDWLIITFDPLTFNVVAPVLRDPILRKLERRVQVGVEFAFL